MIKYIDKGTARQHLIDRLMESALNNAGIKADVDAVFLDIAKNRLPVWIDELQTYDVQEVCHGRWLHLHLDPDNITGHTKGECSICGKLRIVDNYCPNCGAKMDEVEENG